MAMIMGEFYQIVRTPARCARTGVGGHPPFAGKAMGISCLSAPPVRAGGPFFL